MHIATLQRRLQESSELAQEYRMLSACLVDDFDVIECIGSGSHGAAFKVRRARSERHYVIKAVFNYHILENLQDDRATILHSRYFLDCLNLAAVSLHPGIAHHFGHFVSP